MSRALQTWNTEALRRRAGQSRQLAAYTVGELTRIGWPAW
jgi:hypothetical protein